jgi:hypothetical protein
LFKNPSTIKNDYFRTYANWTGRTSGVSFFFNIKNKTYTIYSGSAHSSFENNLPGGEAQKLRCIFPPTSEEFKILCTDENSVNFYLKISH